MGVVADSEWNLNRPPPPAQLRLFSPTVTPSRTAAQMPWSGPGPGLLVRFTVTVTGDPGRPGLLLGPPAGPVAPGFMLALTGRRHGRRGTADSLLDSACYGGVARWVLLSPAAAAGVRGRSRPHPGHARHVSRP
jgi:hypothetical protein